MGSVAGQHRGDGGADAPGGAGDQGGAAGERGGPVGDLAGGGVGDLDDLAADVRGAGREQEAQGGLGGGDGPGGDAQQLHGGALADLLAQGADEALQGLLGGGLVVVVR